MNSYLHLTSLSRKAGILLVLGALSMPIVFAETPAKAATDAGEKAAERGDAKIENYRSDNSEVSKAEVKAALDQIDAELEHLDHLADAAPTAQEKTEIRIRYQSLKDRRDDLKKDFNRARYEAFKADLKAEKDRLANWSRDKFSNQPGASDAVNATRATADTTAEKISDYRADNSEINKAEAKAALNRLDVDLDLLAAKIDTIADPSRQSELRARLGTLRERRRELNGEYRQARYDALSADVKAEWNRIIH